MPRVYRRITMDDLQRLAACYTGRVWFETRFPHGASLKQLCSALVKDGHADWVFWLVEELGDITVLDELERMKFNFDTTRDTGGCDWTLLVYLVYAQSTDDALGLVRHLLELGANPNAVIGGCKTALNYANARAKDQPKDYADLLEEYGAKTFDELGAGV